MTLARILTTAAFVAASAVAAQAQDTCGGTYRVQPGDSLSTIADKHYKNAGMWTAIHNNNLSVIGPTPDRITIGMKLSLTCLNGLPAGLPDGTPVDVVTRTAAPIEIAPGTAATRQKINLLTADDYAPFTDRKSPNGGLVTEVVQAAMEQAAPEEGFAIHWVNDWSAHLEPLLSNALLDLGFPWLRPDCEGNPSQYRCENFHFSDPMFEMLILLFTDTTRQIRFTQDSDIEGKTLCRPAGYYTHDLEKDGRNWLTDSKITLEQPDSVADCFAMLMNGEVDAVALNEFTGRTAIKDLNLTGRVSVAQGKPLSIEGLHVVVHKSHPQALAMLDTINTGLREIKANGTYQQIIDSQMSQIWAGF